MEQLRNWMRFTSEWLLLLAVALLAIFLVIFACLVDLACVSDRCLGALWAK